MGLFRRKQREAIVHPPVERVLYVSTSSDALAGSVDGYARVMGKHARELEAAVDVAAGWLRLRLPSEGLHPWEAVNLAYWLNDLGEILLVSGPSPTFPGHWLARSADPNDLLEGWTETGEAVTVYAPTNQIVRPDPEVVQPRRTAGERLAAAGIPTDGWQSQGEIIVRSEDPQHDLGPTLEDTVPDRRALRPFGVDFSI